MKSIIDIWRENINFKWRESLIFIPEIASGLVKQKFDSVRDWFENLPINRFAFIVDLFFCIQLSMGWIKPLE